MTFKGLSSFCLNQNRQGKWKDLVDGELRQRQAKWFHRLLPTVYRTVNKRKWNLWVSQGHIIKGASSSQPLVVEVAPGACVEVENQKRRLLCKRSNTPFAFGNYLGAGGWGGGDVAERGVIMSGLLDRASMEMPDSLEAHGMCATVKVNRDAGICQNSLHLLTLLFVIRGNPLLSIHQRWNFLLR